MNELFIFIKPESSVRLSCLRDKVVGPDYRSVCMVPCGGDGAARRIITVLWSRINGAMGRTKGWVLVVVSVGGHVICGAERSFPHWSEHRE